jgi:DNA repair exonuclease SbcCD ATPase subunit
MTQYEFDGAEYSVGTEDQIEEAAKESVENLLDDVGYEGFRGSFVENFIDEDEIERYIRDFFDYDIRENPESYLDDDQRELSSSQEREIRELQEEERTLEVERARLYKEKEELDTDSDDWEEKYDEMEERISEIEDRLTEIVDEIDEIKENPDGDYSEDAIDSAIDDRVDEYTRYPESFVSNYIGEEYSKWLQNNNMIDKDAFIEGVVEADGYGMCLNTYDGSYDTININGTDYYIVRTN